MMTNKELIKLIFKKSIISYDREYSNDNFMKNIVKFALTINSRFDITIKLNINYFIRGIGHCTVSSISEYGLDHYDVDAGYGDYYVLDYYDLRVINAFLEMPNNSDSTEYLLKTLDFKSVKMIKEK